MGCDIHAHVEYYDTPGSKDTSNLERAFCYSSDVCVGRNYWLFNLLAGVRGIGSAVFSLRGVPKIPTLSYEIENKYYLSVVDVVPNSSTFRSNGNYILREDADRLVASGEAVYHEDNYKIINPAWHTPSFLYKKELIEIRRQYLIKTIEYDASEYKGKKRKDALNIIKNSSEVELMRVAFPSIECVRLNATIASMIAIENSGEYQSRFVFWFDS